MKCGECPYFKKIDSRAMGKCDLFKDRLRWRTDNVCKGFKAMHMTNEDRVKNLDTDQFAEFLYEVQMTLIEFVSPKIEVQKTWQEWLKSEVIT